MGKQRDIMINFPLPILAKSFTKSGCINLRPMLLEAMRTHIGQYCVSKRIRPDSTVLIIPGIKDDLLSRIVASTCYNHLWEDSFEFPFGWDMIEAALNEFTKAHNRYRRNGNPPYCSISLSVWLDFMDNEAYKDEFEKAALLAAMAVRSIVGPHTAKPIVWEFILSRMAGNAGKCDLSTLPEVIQMYDQTKHRKLKEKLIRQLQKCWGIQYLFSGRKPWYCTDSKVNLPQWIASKNGTPI